MCETQLYLHRHTQLAILGCAGQKKTEPQEKTDLKGLQFVMRYCCAHMLHIVIKKSKCLYTEKVL